MNLDVVATKLACLATLVALGGCVTPPDVSEPPRTITVNVPTPVPCEALAALGAEPSYPDTDEALRLAPGIGQLAQLYRAGRAMRQQRLDEYITARAACQALGE
jgi:hypothetical protein